MSSTADKTSLGLNGNSFSARGALTIGGAITVALGAGLAAQSADAAFITTSFPANTTLDLTNGTATINVDLNGDGVTDYQLGANDDFVGTFISPQGNNLVVQDPTAALFNPITKSSQNFAAALANSSLIGPSSDFATGQESLVKHQVSNGNLYGPWSTAQDSVLGLEFFIPADGLYHYGFIEGTAQVIPGANGGADDLVITLDSFGYDPAPAPVPEPGSLSLLAMGAAGVAALRRRNKNRIGA